MTRRLFGLFISLLFLGVFLSSSPAAGQEGATPEQLVQKITNEVLAAVKSDQQLAAGDREKALKLAEEKVLPHIDFEYATRIAVGRAWRKASPEQRKQLVDAFRSMLVRIYSNSISSYEGQTLQVLPSRGAQDPEDATVRTQFIGAGGKPLPIDFQARKTEQGWKIYDIVVEGISLVLTYKSEFDAVVRDQGIEGLIKRMNEKNAPAKVAR